MSTNIFYVYALRRSDSNEPFYIGKGKNSRIDVHFRPTSDQNQHKYNTIQKAIKEGVDIAVDYLWSNLDEYESLRREVWAIKIWGRRDLGEGPLTNQTNGGEGLCGYNQSESTKNKISQGNKGKPKSLEHRKALSKAKIGTKQSQDTIDKRVAKQIETNKSPETKARRSEATKGRVWNDSSKEKSSTSAKNRPKFTCEFCGLLCQASGYKTYHGQRCKKNFTVSQHPQK